MINCLQINGDWNESTAPEVPAFVRVRAVERAHANRGLPLVVHHLSLGAHSPVCRRVCVSAYV